MNALLLLAALASANPTSSEAHHDHSDKIGQVDFQNTCSPAADAIFAEGVAWLHSFEYEEAEKTFNKAAEVDPFCSIAQWGVAMSLYHPLWAPPTTSELERGRAAVAKVLARPLGSERERAILGAVAQFYRNSETVGHGPRVQA